jgi:hypothetical protein
MSKQDHNESFVIEVSIAPKGVYKISIRFSIGVDFIWGSRNDYGQLMDPNFGSFGSPLFAEKVDD